MKHNQRIPHPPQRHQRKTQRRDLARPIREVEQADGQPAQEHREVEPREEGALVGEEDFGLEAEGQGDALAFWEELVLWSPGGGFGEGGGGMDLGRFVGGVGLTFATVGVRVTLAWRVGLLMEGFVLCGWTVAAGASRLLGLVLSLGLSGGVGDAYVASRCWTPYTRRLDARGGNESRSLEVSRGLRGGGQSSSCVKMCSSSNVQGYSGILSGRNAS